MLRKKFNIVRNVLRATRTYIFGEDRVLGKSYTFLEDGDINENFYVDDEGALVPVSPVGQATPSGGMPPLVK